MQITYNDLKQAVLGSGPMGIIIASLLAEKYDSITLWIPDKEFVELLKKRRQTEIMGKTIELPDHIDIVSSLDAFGRDDWAFHIAVPSRSFLDSVHSLIEVLEPFNNYVFSFLTKGILDSKNRKKTGFITYSQYLQNYLSERNFNNASVAVVNGPSLLGEILEEKFSFFNIGSSDKYTAEYLSEVYTSHFINTSITDDVIGMEIVGVAKNPMAIASGIVSLLPRYGSNLLGEILSVGFQEVRDLAMRYGARPDTVMGRSGLADFITTATSNKSRNRGFGQKIVGELLSGGEKLSIKDRIEIFFAPRSFIERESTKWHDNVEGTYALSILIELANEIRLPFTLHRTLFDVLTRKQPPGSLIDLICGKKTEAKNIPLVVQKKVGLNLTSGIDFHNLLVDRIMKQISNVPGTISRVKKQSSAVIESTQKRLTKAKRKKQKLEEVKFESEIEIWQRFQNCQKDEELTSIKELVRFYVSEIADNYSPTVRESVLRFVAPIRLFSGGFLKGSMIPHIGGKTEVVKALSSKYNLLYAPTHRSHLDSVEVAYSLFHLGLPVPRYAAGINLMSNPFWEWMLKSLGAYAVDRERTRNSLYLECLTLYSQVMLEQGIPSLVYPEGTRSRTGAIVPVKTGLLTTAVNAFRSSGTEIVIVPISVSYETVPEDNQFCNMPEELGMAGFLAKRSNVYVEFCDPIPISEYAHTEDPTIELSYRITKGWKQYHKILPNQIVAKILVENDYSVDVSQSTMLIEDFISRHEGNYLIRDPEEIWEKGKKILEKRKMIEEANRMVHSKNDALLLYYASMIPEDEDKKY
ncbi:glycerol-3-phosphate dehydrogenase [Leptospira levettii]|uniref:1-acyl-sn-glycerol-3-phosphate acyltransferase n=1 Tax=Leptospira levettii TaxID=2023178 RepID=UPI0010828924|nr:1-acyl-sn-glycerol-3-phosphate acyltransferase [Leptospira levettii]MCW7496075.1 1-acyl-sn-glycerol-3-phosphate acyltransferase [Leptospira levettii]MCW7507551.1 1-acyl-sn-glycerol-3-phosphate acyltransferase [Leptospira levettii]MCW7518641.1 1-acyl-sn-glycerol-3-phosphate acyltransferase [Leptospira levettii]TGM25338.1 glycerol-3-phosphate dehydrogenase [Leptospira levettii]TGM76272.1 glycerol-3-phosphate dehydrogenase [Leptospira levettii]